MFLLDSVAKISQKEIAILTISGSNWSLGFPGPEASPITIPPHSDRSFGHACHIATGRSGNASGQVRSPNQSKLSKSVKSALPHGAGSPINATRAKIAPNSAKFDGDEMVERNRKNMRTPGRAAARSRLRKML